MLLGGESHVPHDLHDEIVPVLGRLHKAREGFFEEPELVGDGVGITEGWADDGDLFVWD